MPDNDLGRARGKIVIDSDKKGVDDSERALGSLSRTIRRLEATLNKFERSLNQMERNLEAAARRADRLDRSLDDLDDGFGGVERSSRRSSRAVKSFDADLASMIQTATRAYRVVNTLYRPFQHVRDSLASFNDANTLRGYISAINHTTMFSRALRVLGGRLVGVDRAYRELGPRQNAFVRNAAKLTAAVAGMAVAERVVGKVVPAFGKMIAKMDSAKKAGIALGKTLEVVNNYAIFGEGKIQRYAQSFMRVAYGMDNAATGAGRLYRNLRQVTKGFDGAGRGAVQAIIGFKIFQQSMEGIRRSFGGLSLKGLDGDVKLVLAGIVAAISALGPLSEIAAKGLTMLSNGFNLLWNGIKQLSGGLLTLPGFFGSFAAAIVPAVFALKGLSDKFKGITGTAAEFWEAMEKLPEHLKPLGISLRRLSTDIKKLQEPLQKKLLTGISDDVENLRANYVPAIRKSFSSVIGAYNDARSKLSEFLFSDATVTDFNRAFMTIEGTLRNLNRAIVPFANGMRDLTIVGMQFFRDWSAGAGGLATRFEEWVAAGRKTGELRQRMDDALEGAKNLVRGMDQLIRATWKLLTLFATDSGDNALERFADAMKRFNQAVDESKANGFLKEFSGLVKGLGFEKLKELGNYLAGFRTSFKELADAVIPLVQGISSAFKDTFTPAIKIASQILEQFAEMFEGLEPAIGWLLGIAAGMKLIGAVVKPMLNAGKAVAGIVIGIKGLGAVLSGNKAVLGAFALLFDRIIPGPSRIAMFDKLSRTLAKVRTALVGVAGVGGAAAAAIGLVLLNGMEADKQIREFNNTLSESKNAFTDWKEGLTDAFGKDSGLVGGNVFDQITNGMTQMRANLEAEASHVPGWMDNLQDFWNAGIMNRAEKDAGGSGVLDFGQSKDFNAMQKAAQDAERAKQKFDELGLSSEDLAGIVAGSDSVFKDFAQTIRESGDSGPEAAAKLEEYRATFVAMRDEFKEIGPGAVNVSEGIALIAEAGGDATTKLQGLKQALQGLGLDKSTEIENAFAYADAIRAIGDEAAKAVDAEAGLGDVWNADGSLNTASVNAQNLFGVLRDAVDKFQQVAVDTGNAQAAFAELEGQLPKLAAAFTPVGGNVADTERKIREFVTSIGGVPDIVSILVSLEGGDKIKQDLAAILLDFQTSADSEIKIPLTADKAALQQALDEIFGAGKAAVGDYGVTIDRANITPEAQAELQRILGANGIQAPGAPAPAAPATVPVQPVPAAGGPKPLIGGAGASTGASTTPPPVVAPPAADTAKLDAANAKIKELENTIKAINEQKTRVEISVDKVDEAKTKLDELKAKIGEFTGKVEFQIVATGYDETVFVVNQVTESVTRLIAETAKIAGAFQTAFQQAMTHANTFVAQFNSVMDGLSSRARAQGEAFVNALAAGIAENPAAIAAAETLAEEIRKRFHQSPPKKGPLAAHGDAAKYAGSEFVNAYATGMGGNQAAAGAANNMASGVAGQAAAGPYELGKLLGAFKDIFDFGRKIFDAFMQITDVMFEAAKLMADPMGKGEFFGQKLYGRDKSVSDRQLERQREDRLQSKMQSATERGARDGTGAAYSDDESLLSNVPAGIYSQTQAADLTKGIADCSSAVEDLVNIMDGRPTGGREMSTGNAAQWLSDHGFIQGEGEIGDFRVAFSPSHMQATLPGGTPFNWGSPAAAARGGVGGSGADDPDLRNRWYRPIASDVRDAIREDFEEEQNTPKSAVARAAEGLTGGPDLSDLTEVEREMLANGQYSSQTQEQMLQALRDQDGTLDQALSVLQDGNATNEDIYSQLPVLDQAIQAQSDLDTPTSRQNASALESIRGDTMSERGIVEQDPIGQAQEIAGSAANVAQSVFKAIESGFEAAAATAQIGDMLVRGIENSDDVMKLIDNFQSYLTLAADVASAVASGLNVAAGIAGASGGTDGGAASGGLSAASQVASLISAGISTVNGIIDLAQEAYTIAGKYVGEFLGFLTGGMGGQLMGDVKFLLDEVDGTLKTWSKDNPEDKREFQNPFNRDPQGREPRVGEINIFPERGADPAQITNEMMFAVSAASSGAWSN